MLTKLKRRARVSVTGCWEWVGYRDPHGYGRFCVGNTPRLAHRLMFECYFGRVPPLLRHLCNNPSCINPAHVVPGTSTENARDTRRAGRLGGFAKPRLTPETVEEARRRLSCGESQAAVARKLNVDKSTIHLLAKGRTWQGELYGG